MWYFQNVIKSLAESGYHSYLTITAKQCVLFVRNAQNNGAIAPKTNNYLVDKGFMFEGSAQDKDNLLWSLYDYKADLEGC